MKRRIIILTIVCLLFNMMLGTVIYAENTKINENGQIIINGNMIEERYAENSNGKLIPFRAVFESLGAEVDWYATMQEAMSREFFCSNVNNRMSASYFVIVTFLSEVYTCSFYELDRNNEILRTMYITNPSVYDNVFGHQLMLEPTGPTGWYEMVDDSIYVYSQTAQYFLKALGFNLEIDEEQNTITITPKTIN